MKVPSDDLRVFVNLLLKDAYKAELDKKGGGKMGITWTYSPEQYFNLLDKSGWVGHDSGFNNIPEPAQATIALCALLKNQIRFKLVQARQHWQDDSLGNEKVAMFFLTDKNYGFYYNPIQYKNAYQLPKRKFNDPNRPAYTEYTYNIKDIQRLLADRGIKVVEVIAKYNTGKILQRFG